MSYIDKNDDRLTGLTCSDEMRQRTAAAGGILEGELHFTSIQRRAFYENHILAPVVHGDETPIADEAAMLALNTTSDRGCFRGDVCIRPDSTWLCIKDRGTSIDQWLFIGGAESAIIIDGGDFTSEPPDGLDGGNFSTTPPDVVDAGRFAHIDTISGGTFT